MPTSSITTCSTTPRPVSTSKRPTTMINVDKTSKTQNMSNNNKNNAYGVGNDDNDEMQILLDLERQTNAMVRLLQLGALSTTTDGVVNYASVSNQTMDRLCTTSTPNKNKSRNGLNKPKHRGEQADTRLQWCCGAVSAACHVATTSSSTRLQPRHTMQNINVTTDLVDGQKTNQKNENQNNNINVYNDADNVGYKYENVNINSDVDTTVHWRGRYSKLVKKYFRRIINDDLQLNDRNGINGSIKSQKTTKSKQLKTKKDKWRCVKCNLIVYTRSGLISHCNKHENVQNYSCKYCKRKFGNRTSLIRHERIHTGERPFECDMCNKKFVQKYALTLHKQTHDKIKNYQCDICLKRYTQNGSLRRHRRTIHHITNTNK